MAAHILPRGTSATTHIIRQEASLIMRKVLLASAAAALFVVLTGRLLPPVVASHFDFAGNPDSFLSRSSYLTLMVVFAAGLPLVIAAAGRWAASLSDDLLNIPNKAYWLAPERRAASLASLAARVEWLAVALAAFLCYAHWLVVRANTGGSHRLAGVPFIVGFGAFLIFTTGWAVSLVLRFRDDR